MTLNRLELNASDIEIWHTYTIKAGLILKHAFKIVSMVYRISLAIHAQASASAKA